jgi:hypothetical protein
MISLLHLKMNLQVKCALLKRVTYILDYAFYTLTGSGLYTLGTQNLSVSKWLFLLAFLCFIGSYELGYWVSHLIIREELEKSKNE